ncbi:exodeoxyribonuclease VII large subunit [Micropruina glycogenica]|uniref:Exodeoxyribonuclease 7 large subunit n=1 Tax=Micropruina glycogenica TaxID=75385 RepID=A0A2N9JIM6_9ACTN|nr:exodeoxyribonuclease VII large subunit [Micropruina glycogenica]SPD87626.1 Exodeoxyribonuclease 7 large subunit [Micropruina glycogenica]
MSLQSSPDQPQPLRVVVQQTKAWVERCGTVWVTGQLIELKRRSGAVTHFLTLRDAVAEVSMSVTASTAVLDAAGPLAEGMEVVALVRPTVWTRNGSLNFECTDLRTAGEGRLLAAIEQRKRMLQAEGLFDPARKRALPFLPRGVGLVTGQGSAAERDVLQVARLRWPGVRFVVRHAVMQGQGCVEDVREALGVLDRDPSVDVIVVARGGGSVQDLLPFSDESLARAVFACRTPVISAIGHEPDTPIIDLVADVRAATPTDAAKRVVPDVANERAMASQAVQRLRGAMLRLIDREVQTVHALRSRPVLADPLGPLTVQSDRLDELRRRCRRAALVRLREDATWVEHTLSRVRALSPRATLLRGYAILSDADGLTIDSTAAVETGQVLRAMLADGTLHAQVTEVDRREDPA